MPHKNTLDSSRSALLVVDVQEAFRNVIDDFERLAMRGSVVVRGFQILDLPVFVAEQYPKGLGRTAKEIKRVLPDGFKVFEKTAFSSCGADAFITELERAEIKQVVICGLETHVCVNQTAHDLLDRSFQ